MIFRKPRLIHLDRILLRLAIEDAAQQAMRKEFNRQIAAQIPGARIQFTSLTATITFEDPVLNVPGLEFAWQN